MVNRKYRVFYPGFKIQTKKELLMIQVGIIMVLTTSFVSNIALESFSALKLVNIVALIWGGGGITLMILGILFLKRNKVFLTISSNGFTISHFYKGQFKEKKMISATEIVKLNLDVNKGVPSRGSLKQRKYFLDLILDSGEEVQIGINPKDAKGFCDGLLYYKHVDSEETLEVLDNLKKVSNVEKSFNSFILKGVIAMVLSIIIFSIVIVYFFIFYKQ